jgi:hypothetical protein
MTRSDFNQASTDAESACQNAQQFFIRCVLNRRCRYSNSQRPVVLADNFTSRRARDHSHLE